LAKTQEGLDFTVYDDYYLLRFLRARKFDLEKANEMFTKFLKWRKDFGTDQIDTFEFNELPVIKLHYPHGYHKTDKLGRPIYIELIGDINPKELFQYTNEERLLKYYVKEYERLLKGIYPACSNVAGKRVEQSISILDMKNEAMKFMFGDTKKFVEITTDMAQNYYPEILGQMFIINAPFSFKAIWAMFKSFVDEKTRKKINIEGSSYKKKLLNFIDPDNLPSFLGGNCVCSFNKGGCLRSDIGPWNPNGNFEG